MFVWKTNMILLCTESIRLHFLFKTSVLFLYSVGTYCTVNLLYRKYKSSVQEKSGIEFCCLLPFGHLFDCELSPSLPRALYKKYKTLYKRNLEQTEVQESMRAKLRELEEQLDVTNILIARQQARLEVRWTSLCFNLAD